MNKITHCSDCKCAIGELHELFCTKELCPFCYGQLASCACIHSVLNLNEDESKAVDEYINDLVDPLKSVMARWKKVLEKKGRIPLGEDLKILGIEA